MPHHQFIVSIKTGDYPFSGTDATVKIALHDDHRKTEPLNIDNFFHNDFERGQLDVFNLPTSKTKNIEKVRRLEIFRDESGLASAWFVEKITVENRSTGDEYIFPVFRWLRPHYHYIFKEHDTSLPQDDEQKEQRKLDLEEKRKTYEIDMTNLELPAMLKSLPDEESFVNGYKWDIKKEKYRLIALSRIKMLTSGSWKSLEDVFNIYTRDVFHVPKMAKFWSEDWFFGYQRQNGPVPNLIRLCTQIPEKLAVKAETLLPFLEGKTLPEAISEKSLFVCNLASLENLELTNKNNVLCAPIALLYRNLQKTLVPIAIQLFQEPSPCNPVFFPSDDDITWKLVKIWYNNAEAAYHEANVHFGLTHMKIEGISLALHRNISVSHPVYRLLAPHLLYLFSVNKLAVMKLIGEGGWMDATMTGGSAAAHGIIKRKFNEWRLGVEGSLPDDLEERGVYDKDILPDYHYRDDALLLHDAIKKYVKGYLNVYYDSPSKLEDDVEIQSWAQEMTKSRDTGGIGVKDIPGNGKFSEVGQLVKTLTSIIFTCSVQHAAVNFPQYDHYGFPPSYPLYLNGVPPTDKRTRNGSDIIAVLPGKTKTFDGMIITKILSNKGTQSLGDFEIDYVYDPKALPILQQFRQDLKDVGKIIEARNKARGVPYDYLHPDSIPNAISI